MKVCQEISFKDKKCYRLKTHSDCDYVGGIRRRALVILTPLNQQNVQTCPIDFLYYKSQYSYIFRPQGSIIREPSTAIHHKTK
jgi:hypothetical protein